MIEMFHAVLFLFGAAVLAFGEPWFGRWFGFTLRWLVGCAH